ncbi:MAG: CAAX prenyl protease-related protein [Chthoniobacteraceae bacterium]
MFGATSSEKAYLAPFIVFMLMLGLGELVSHFFDGRALWFFSAPRYWVFPLQTVVCALLLAWGWRHYELGPPRRVIFTTLIGVLVLAIWISPQEILGMPARRDGFEPGFFGEGWAWWINTSIRFIRLVIVVPLLEEIFWRGFLLRHLIREPFNSVPFGSFSWLSFGIVTVLFGLAHWGPDFWPAIATGALYNLVAYRTRSLSSCVLAHALTNLLLGIYILRTGQWGFW